MNYGSGFIAYVKMLRDSDTSLSLRDAHKLGTEHRKNLTPEYVNFIAAHDEDRLTELTEIIFQVGPLKYNDSMKIAREIYRKLVFIKF